jgi:hypothetical protein
MTRAASTDERITRDDLEAKFREVIEDTREEVASAKATLATVATLVAVILVAIAFLVGRRQGRKRTTIVEIRRM